MANPSIDVNRIYTNKSLDIRGNIIDKNGWDVYEYTTSLTNTVFGIDIFIYNTWGKDWWGTDPWDSLLFSVNSGNCNTFFTNFNESDPTMSSDAFYWYGTYKDTSFQQLTNFELVDEPEHEVRVNNILVSNILDVAEGMVIEGVNVKSSQYVPTIVALDSSNLPIPSKSEWKDGTFTYTVPEGVKKVIIQVYNDYKNTVIQTQMPHVLLAASYKNDKLMDYIIKSRYNIEKIDLSNEYNFNTYYVNYVLKLGFNKILVTAKHGTNNVKLEKNTIKKNALLGFDVKKDVTFPNSVSTVDSYIYATLLNRIESLEHRIKGKLMYDEILNTPDYVTRKEFEKIIKTTASGITIEIDSEINWDDIKSKPSWITLNKPDVAFFNGVPSTRKINGMELINDITVTAALPIEVLDIINNIKSVWDLPETIYNKNILIGDKIYFGEPHEQIIGEETQETYDSFFEYDYARSAMTFNGNFYVTGGIAALESYNLGSGASLTIYNGLDSTATTISLSAAMGKKLKDDLVPKTTKINNSALTSDITINTTTLGGVPNTRKINYSALTEDLYITCANIGAVPTSTKINGSALTQNLSITCAGIGAVPETLKINGSALTQDLTINVSTSSISDGTYTFSTTGGQIGGDLRLKNSSNYGLKLLFGDANYCYLHENSDDHLNIYANKGITLDYVDKLYFSGTTSNYFEYDASNAALKYNGNIYTNGTNGIGYKSGSDYIYVPAQFDVIKTAFLTYSAITDIRQYIVDNLK